MREEMAQWDFVIAAYAIGLVALAVLTIWAWRSMARAEAKLAVLCLMCVESAMPFGGQIRIHNRAGGWQVTGESGRLKVDADLWRAFADGSLEASAPAQVEFAFARQQAAALGRALAMERRHDLITVSF